MTKKNSISFVLVLLAGLATVLTGCQTSRCVFNPADSSRNVSATTPSGDLNNQIANIGDEVNFEIGGKLAYGGTSRWFFNGYPIDANNAAALGVTNYDTSHLKIISASTNNCGSYSYETSSDKWLLGNKASHTVQLLIIKSTDRQNNVVVYGTPAAGAGNSGTACPGAYVGYVQYAGPWYFTNGGTATDGTGATDTKVVYYGLPFSNMGCGPNVPTSKYPYHFSIFFKNSVPTGPYPLNLHFN